MPDRYAISTMRKKIQFGRRSRIRQIHRRIQIVFGQYLRILN